MPDTGQGTKEEEEGEWLLSIKAASAGIQLIHLSVKFCTCAGYLSGRAHSSLT